MYQGLRLPQALLLQIDDISFPGAVLFCMEHA
jgi:hypothetical protein